MDLDRPARGGKCCRLTALAGRSIEEPMRADGRSDEVADGVLEVALDAREPVSARKSALAEALTAATETILARPGVRVAVLHLAADATDEQPRPDTRARAEAECRAEQAAVERLAALPVSVVAHLSGRVTGPLFEIAVACSARVASPGTRVGLDDLAVGLAPRLGGLRRIAQLAGLDVAVELGARGTIVDAARAQELGLVDAIADEQGTREGALALTSPPRAASRQERSPGARLRRRTPIADLRAALHARHDVGFPAELAVVDQLEAICDGEDTAALEVGCFGELVLSTTARNLRALRRAARSLEVSSVERGTTSPLVQRLLAHGLSYAPEAATAALADEAFAWRIFEPLRNEMRALVKDGVAPARVETALAEWGLEHELRLGPGAGPGTKIARELIQMRCVLPLVAEALRALEEGRIASAERGDVASVFLGGFPAFRGGVFRYVDDVGAAELRERLLAFARDFGPRYSPPALLERLARDGGRVHAST
jgi:enoyl-CoA hydratase/carnithine racemase